MMKALVAIIVCAPATAAADCPKGFWIGEEAAVGMNDSLTGLVGWEVGGLVGFPLGQSHCGAVGVGGRVAYVGHAQAAGELRLSFDGGGDAFSRHLYLEGGPLADHGLGLDLQAGADWTIAGLFVDAYLPHDQATTVVAGARFSIEGLFYLITHITLPHGD